MPSAAEPPVVRERFATHARGRPYHAALVDLRGESTPHGHEDYYEVMVVAEGEGTQRLPHGTQRLDPGDVLLIRPGDEHALAGTGPAGVRFFNIAFPTASWRDFGALAALDRSGAWDTAPLPPRAGLDGARAAAALDACRRALSRFHDDPTALDLVRFWTDLVPLLPPTAGPAAPVPAWLTAARAGMAREENLRGGVPRLLDLAHVSPAHLSRSMRLYYRTTPTAFVADLRLRHAATLLATTDASVTAIAERCGFGSQSYFTRCFHRAHQASPRDFRRRARRAFVP